MPFSRNASSAPMVVPDFRPLGVLTLCADRHGAFTARAVGRFWCPHWTWGERTDHLDSAGALCSLGAMNFILRPAGLISLLALAVGAGGSAWAAEKAGVQLPDAHELGGQKLVLNGLGLREATIFAVDVYVAGLYLPSKTNDASAILAADVPKHLTMRFVRDVGRDNQVDAWREGFEKNAKDYGAIEGKVEKLLGWMSDIDDGQSMSVSYVPGEGTTVSVKGETKGTIAGEDFQYALYRIYIGPNPPNEGLKTGLLGLE